MGTPIGNRESHYWNLEYTAQEKRKKEALLEQATTITYSYDVTPDRSRVGLTTPPKDMPYTKYVHKPGSKTVVTRHNADGTNAKTSTAANRTLGKEG